MNTLTKEQVRQLAPELQEAFGSLLADEARHRAELMKKVKGHRDRTWFGQARLGALQGMLAYLSFSSWLVATIHGSPSQAWWHVLGPSTVSICFGQPLSSVVWMH
jgi:hypothetical protein